MGLEYYETKLFGLFYNIQKINITTSNIKDSGMIIATEETLNMSENNVNENEIEEDYEPDILTLEDENGQEHTFEVIDATDVDGSRYLAMVLYIEDPAERLEQDSEMLIMKVSELDGEEVLDIVEEEEELYQISQVFYNRLSEVYNIDMEELESELGE